MGLGSAVVCVLWVSSISPGGCIRRWRGQRCIQAQNNHYRQWLYQAVRGDFGDINNISGEMNYRSKKNRFRRNY